MAISSDNAVIGTFGDDDKYSNIRYSYVYTNIGGKWIENGKIVPVDDVAVETFGLSVAF